jgi:hypothetical protein
MSMIKTPISRFALAILFAAGLAVSAQAGTITVQPGASAQLDVGTRDGYTTITVVNTASSAGALQVPAGAATVTVPAGGKAELYDRYSGGRSAGAATYITVTNTGSVPLSLTSRYQTAMPAP